MQSLRDKLLKAGLVTEEQAKKAEEKAPAQREPRPPKGAPEAKPSKESFIAVRLQPRPPPETSIPKLPPMPGSKAHQRIEAKKQVELDRQLRELVVGAQVPVEPGQHTFYFVTRKGKLRRLEVSEAQARLLENGQLAVVERREPAQIEHSLVPPDAAEKMHALSDKSVRFYNRPGSPIGFVSDDEAKQRQLEGEEAAAQGE
jgi:hypothetical protein